MCVCCVACETAGAGGGRGRDSARALPAPTPSLLALLSSSSPPHRDQDKYEVVRKVCGRMLLPLLLLLLLRV